MNVYMKMQVQNAIVMADSLVKSCELAAVRDDGTVSKEEEKQLKKIKKITENFKSELRKVIS